MKEKQMHIHSVCISTRNMVGYINGSDSNAVHNVKMHSIMAYTHSIAPTKAAETESCTPTTRLIHTNSMCDQKWFCDWKLLHFIFSLVSCQSMVLQSMPKTNPKQCSTYDYRHYNQQCYIATYVVLVLCFLNRHTLRIVLNYSKNKPFESSAFCFNEFSNWIHFVCGKTVSIWVFALSSIWRGRVRMQCFQKAKRKKKTKWKK